MYISQVPSPTLTISKEDYERGLKVDVSEHTEQVGKLTYVNVHYAQLLWRQHFPDIDWIVLSDPGTGLPFFDIDQGRRGSYFAIVFRRDDQYSQIFYYPAMRRPGKGERVISPALERGNARQLHDSLMRAIVRAMADFAGLGKMLWLKLDSEEVGEILDPAFKEEPPKRGKSRREEPEDEDLDDEDEDDDGDDDEDDEDEDEDPMPRRKTSRTASRRSTSRRNRR